MSKKTHITLQTEWKMEDIYNLLMSDIEPDLMTENISILDDLYSYESEEERKSRMEWYAEAMIIFKDRFEKFARIWKEEMTGIRSTVRDEQRAPEERKDRQKMRNVERSIDES